MSWLSENVELWDAVFREGSARPRFLTKLCRARDATRVLDVGCATGTLAAELMRRGLEVTGVDVNPRFVAAARVKCPSARFDVGDMRTFRLRSRFDVVICLGTTLAYGGTTERIVETLANFRRHLAPGGAVVVDVLNAIALAGARPFRAVTRHRHELRGERVDAVIRHRLLARSQCLTEQVTWTHRGKQRRDAEDRHRLFFPEELTYLVKQAGLRPVTVRSSFEADPRDFSGRRLIVIAER